MAWPPKSRRIGHVPVDRGRAAQTGKSTKLGQQDPCEAERPKALHSFQWGRLRLNSDAYVRMRSTAPMSGTGPAHTRSFTGTDFANSWRNAMPLSSEGSRHRRHVFGKLLTGSSRPRAARRNFNRSRRARPRRFFLRRLRKASRCLDYSRRCRGDLGPSAHNRVNNF